MNGAFIFINNTGDIMSIDRKPDEPTGSFKLFPNILLLIPFLALLWVPLTSVIIYIVYKADKP